MSMTDFVESGIKGLGLRFTLVNLGPTALLILFVLALLFSGAPARPPDIALLGVRARQVNIPAAIAIGALVLGVSLILEPMQLALVQWLEGYWGTSRVAASIGRRRTEAYRRRRQELEKQIERHAEEGNANSGETQDRAWWLTTLYPSASRMMPTLLGNALRAAEDRPFARYRLDAVLTWPRLYPLLTESLRAVLDDRRNQLDLAARMCVTLMMMTVVSATMLAAHGWWLAMPIAIAMLAGLSYRGTVLAAIAYGESVQTAFDLHRFDLMRALHLPLPTTRESEKQANQALCDFLRQGVPVDFVYDHPTSPTAGERPGTGRPD